MSAEQRSKLLWFLVTLLLGVTGFAGKQVFAHEQRLTTIEERVPADLKERLTRIEGKLDALQVMPHGNVDKGPGSHGR